MIAAVLLMLAVLFVLLVFAPHHYRTPPAPISMFDLCEICSAPAPYELGEVHEQGAEGGSGMIATYCRKHAPPEAVKVR